jgi:hypothetical protein
MRHLIPSWSCVAEFWCWPAFCHKSITTCSSHCKITAGLDKDLLISIVGMCTTLYFITSEGGGRGRAPLWRQGQRLLFIRRSICDIFKTFKKQSSGNGRYRVKSKIWQFFIDNFFRFIFKNQSPGIGNTVFNTKFDSFSSITFCASF